MRLLQTPKLMLAIALSALCHLTNAQNEKSNPEDKTGKSTIQIRVTEDESGKTRHFEKTYETNALTSKERDALIDKVLDSLGANKKGKQSISITIDDGNGNFLSKNNRKVIIDRRDEREPLAYHLDKDLSYYFDSEKLQHQMRRLEKEFKPKARVWMKDMENFGNELGSMWAPDAPKASSVRALSVYANNPDNGILNLRFNVPDKGNVTVTVTDTNGKEVGKKEIKDFEGEFVGQVELKKNTKGTLFVTVVQNEDGTVKRVVIP